MRSVRLAVALVAALVGCEQNPFCPDEPPRPTPPPASTPSSNGGPPASMNLDSGLALEHADPPPLAGDLRAEIDGFHSLEQCVAQHAAIDPLVGDAVRALGYDTLVRDACRIVDALKAKDASSCAAIAATGVQTHCEALVAMELQNPDGCPWIASSDRTLGHDPMCLGVAQHDPRVCGAALLSERATCEALASGDPKRCNRPDPDETRTCMREFDRQKSVLVADVHDARDLTPPKAIVTIKGQPGTADPEGSPVDLSAPIVQGVVVAANIGGGMRVDIAHDLETGLHLPTRGGERTRFVASLIIESEKADPRVEKFHLEGAKLPMVDCPTSQCVVTAKLGKTPIGEWKRGSPITITIDGESTGLTGKFTVHADIDTFVRDLVTRSAMFAPRR